MPDMRPLPVLLEERSRNQLMNVELSRTVLIVEEHAKVAVIVRQLLEQPVLLDVDDTAEVANCVLWVVLDFHPDFFQQSSFRINGRAEGA